MLGIEYLGEAYRAADPDFDAGITVPAMVEIVSGTVATNGFQQLTLDFSTQWTAHHRPGAPGAVPGAAARRDRRDQRGRLRRRQQRVYVRLRLRPAAPTSRPTRRCSAGSTRSRDRLANRRYLVGDTITEADVRLWVTLVRFDAAYHGHFKCNRAKLTECRCCGPTPRDLFQTPGFGDTIDFTQIKQHYYGVHREINPSGIVPAGRDLRGWLTAHGRAELGGRPFGDGTPPGPPPHGERVPPIG